MKTGIKIIILLLGLCLTSCYSSTCPSDTVSYLNPPYPPENLITSPQPQLVQIKNSEVMVDEVITGPVCNDTWTGTIYVTCDIKIPAWEDESFFFQDCDLDIEEGTVVYVEAHGNSPYQKGCSCHE